MKTEEDHIYLISSAFVKKFNVYLEVLIQQSLLQGSSNKDTLVNFVSDMVYFYELLNMNWLSIPFVEELDQKFNSYVVNPKDSFCNHIASIGRMVDLELVEQNVDKPWELVSKNLQHVFKSQTKQRLEIIRSAYIDSKYLGDEDTAKVCDSAITATLLVLLLRLPATNLFEVVGSLSQTS